MASLDTTPVRELSDVELRKRLLVLGYDVPVSVNRDFLVQKLEKASAGGGGGSGRSSKKQQRHSMAVSPPSTPTPSGSSSPARKRKSMVAGTPGRDGGGSRHHHNNVSVSTPISPLATSSPLPPGTPHNQYMGSPASSVGMSTPSTPSPFVSRLNTPSPGGHHNGEAGGSHSPRYLNYYNMFKASSSGGDGGGGELGGGSGGGGGYGYLYNRGINRGSFNPVTSVAPPSRSERNGYSTAGGGGGASGGGLSLGLGESDWCGGHLISKILVISFILFFLIIGGLYIKKNMAVDPRGLTAGGSGASKGESSGWEATTPPPTPAPVKKKKELPPPPTSMVYPVCGLKNVDPEACIPKEVVKNSRTLFNLLKEELTLRARKMGCSSEIKEEAVTLLDAKSKLYTLTELRKTEVESAFQGMLLLITENPRGGLSLHPSKEGEEISSRDVASLDLSTTKVSATGVNPDFICEVTAIMSSLALYISVLLGLMTAGYYGWKGYKHLKAKKELEQEEIFRMVERVLDLLRSQYELSENSHGTPFLAVNHIRDELVPPQERIRKESFWNKVVNYISNHESRVREEIQHISGEEFKVWRWLPSASPLASTKRFSTANSSHHHQQQRGRFSMPGSPMMSSSPAGPSAAAAGPSHASMMSPPPSPPQYNNLYPPLSGLSDDDGEDLSGGGDADTNSNNKWQGQAFETCAGSPNALPTTPTTCLKIRHMFADSRDGGKERARIERHILEKCKEAKILHIGIDSSSVEGCVYVRCLTKDDAGKAFKALHGWWFEGKLLSVKFLREERYFNRFPEAKSCTVPMGV